VKILVTGGAGFIGSHLTRRLLSRGHDVAVADNLTNGREESVPSDCRFLRVDVAEPSAVSSLPHVDAVVHLAAQSSGPMSAEVPYEDLRSNAASTLLLSRWCVDRRIRRFVYASSMAIYGNPQALPVSEDAPCVPLSYYGISKLTSEHLLRVAAADGLQPTSLRFFSVYGPGQNLDNLKQGIVSIYLAYLLRSHEVPVTGSLRRFRDLVHVDDVVRLCADVVERDSTLRPAYNVGSGRPTSVRELLDALVDAAGLPSDFPVRELPGSPSDQFGLYADVTRAGDDLSWTPAVELASGLRSMVEWARTAALAR
jgi:UDP-glucose 4-epimerase